MLEGRVAIVTGAGAGLGKAIADELGRAGAAVAVTEAGPRAADELTPVGIRARAYRLDVTDICRQASLLHASRRPAHAAVAGVSATFSASRPPGLVDWRIANQRIGEFVR